MMEANSGASQSQEDAMEVCEAKTATDDVTSTINTVQPEQSEPERASPQENPTTEAVAPITTEEELPLHIKSNKESVFRYANTGGNFYTGIDITSEEAVQKREARLKRFGLQVQGKEDEISALVKQREARAKRFGMKLVATSEGEPIKLLKRLPQIPDAEVRVEAIHLYGTDEMSTGDIFAYFKLYSPRNIEWVNDSSCNVVWEDKISAARALLGLGRQPVALRDQYEETLPEVMTTGGTGSAQTEDTGTAGHQDTSSDAAGGDGDVSREESKLEWRYGEAHPKAKLLLLRYATIADQKQRGAAKNSVYYKKYGMPGGRSVSGGVSRGRKKDLRSRIGKRQPVHQDSEEEMDVEEEGESLFASLAKRPKPLYSDRPDDMLDVTELMDESEKQRRLADISVEQEGVGLGVGLGGEEGDLRRTLQQKKKRRNLKLRVGHSPRLVEQK